MQDRDLSSPGVQAWYGNAAKMRIIEHIISQPGKKTVFDYGAGTGSGWPATLAEHPEISLVCYEPSATANVLRTRLPGARIIGDDELQNDRLNADYIVSFSVFEHVFDRHAYMRFASRHLAEKGVFFLNYDDGHFRNSLDLGQPSKWGLPIREHIINLGADLWPKVGMIGKYQKRVVREAADDIVRAAGMSIVESRYENLASFKSLARHVPEDARVDFSALWLQTEDALNRDFDRQGEPCLGDASILWREMGSRTLQLVTSART